MQGQKNCRIKVSGLPFNPSKLGEKADGHFPEKKTDRGHSQHQAGPRGGALSQDIHVLDCIRSGVGGRFSVLQTLPSVREASAGLQRGLGRRKKGRGQPEPPDLAAYLSPGQFLAHGECCADIGHVNQS